MRTAVIFTDETLKVKFYILDGDYTKYDNIIINTNENEELEDELSNLLYDRETGRELQEEISKEDFIQAMLDEVELITIGLMY